MKWIWIAAFAIAPMTATAACPNLNTDALPDFAQPQPVACQNAQSLEGPQTICYWQFTFRELAAHTHADLIAAKVRDCGGTRADVQAGVNHPDTFGQVLFKMPNHRVSVSIKDKTALGQTLVFLSITQLN